MAVDLIRITNNITMTGGATWDALTTLPTSQIPNSSSFLLDVIVHGSSGWYIVEGGVVGRFQSVFRKDSVGNLSQLGSIHTIKKFDSYTGAGGEEFSIRNTISGTDIVVEVSGLVASDVILTCDVTIRSL